MSIESLKEKKFSEKSDVWSFGITCIEIITRNKPYPGLNSVQVVTQVIEGLRPNFPQGTRLDLEELISKCWEEDSNERPTFQQLNFKNLLSKRREFNSKIY